MGILRYNFRSLALGRYVDITVIYPTDNIAFFTDQETEERIKFKPNKKDYYPYTPGMKFQTLYLMHGGSEDDTGPSRFTNIESYVQKHHLMVVTPDVSLSFGLDTEYGLSYEIFLAEELPAVMQSLFASSPKREDNFIAGYAMGANVALGTAIRHPDLYSVCVDISGGIGMTLDTQTLVDELNGDHFPVRMPLYNASFGKAEDLPGSSKDLYACAKYFKKKGVPLPKYYLICGSEEFIRYRVERDVQRLQELNYDVDYILAEGYDHNHDMWDYYLKYTVDELLPLKNKPIYPDE
ncbi:MAG: hypothetical protein IJJ29_06115 [Solobacterium sp.]|nr:hypothetical protein [Solobacterium sp.]